MCLRPNSIETFTTALKSPAFINPTTSMNFSHLTLFVGPHPLNLYLSQLPTDVLLIPKTLLQKPNIPFSNTNLDMIQGLNKTRRLPNFEGLVKEDVG